MAGALYAVIASFHFRNISPRDLFCNLTGSRRIQLTYLLTSTVGCEAEDANNAFLQVALQVLNEAHFQCAEGTLIRSDHGYLKVHSQVKVSHTFAMLSIKAVNLKAFCHIKMAYSK